MHQGAWLIWATCAGICAITTTNPFYLLVIVGIAWFVHSVRSKPGPALRSFKVFVAFGLLTMCTRTALVLLSPPVTSSSIVTGLLEGMRLATLLVVFGTFNAVSDPFAILKLAPRRFHEPALATALALSIAPRTIESAAKVREAQRMRGIEVARLRALPALAVPVLETGMEEAMVLAESMDARGHGRGPRTRYRPEAWTTGSIVAIVLSLIPVVASVVASRAGEAGMIVQTYPLAWPVVSGSMIAVLMLLCVPVAIGERES